MTRNCLKYLNGDLCRHTKLCLAHCIVYNVHRQRLIFKTSDGSVVVFRASSTDTRSMAINNVSDLTRPLPDSLSQTECNPGGGVCEAGGRLRTRVRVCGDDKL